MIVDSVMNFNCQLGLIHEGHDGNNKNNLQETYIPDISWKSEIISASLLLQIQLSVVIRMMPNSISWERQLIYE